MDEYYCHSHDSLYGVSIIWVKIFFYKEKLRLPATHAQNPNVTATNLGKPLKRINFGHYFGHYVVIKASKMVTIVIKIRSLWFQICCGSPDW